MLDNSYKNKENSIEEIVYGFLKGCQRVEMSEEVTDFFFQVSTLPSNLKMKQEDKPPVFQIIEKRIDYCFTFKITDQRVLLLISVWAESAGEAILYLWYVQAWCFLNNVREVDFRTFCFNIFPTGIFSKKDLHTLWDNQKISRKETSHGSDNLIDYATAGSSIQFKS